MSFGSIAVITCAGTLLAGVAATHPLELRRNRWWRIGLSLPLVLLIVSIFCELSQVRGYFALWSVALLGFLWMGPMSHAVAGLLQPILYGDLNRSLGIQANFAGAKALRQHGDLDEALKITLGELEKDPLSYEGLLLLADLYLKSGEERKAQHALDRLLQNNCLTASQRRYVLDRRRGLDFLA